jgi:hypothetical protein
MVSKFGRGGVRKFPRVEGRPPAISVMPVLRYLVTLDVRI